jgi:hypothetical protein
MFRTAEQERSAHATPRPALHSRLITLITTVGVVAVMAGGAMVATTVTGVSAAANDDPVPQHDGSRSVVQ